MMDILLDLYSHLDAQQKDMEDLKASRRRAPEMATRPGMSRPSTRTGRGSTRHQADPTMAPHFADATRLEELAKDFRVRIVRRMKQLPLLGPYTMTSHLTMRTSLWLDGTGNP